MLWQTKAHVVLQHLCMQMAYPLPRHSAALISLIMTTKYTPENGLHCINILSHSQTSCWVMTLSGLRQKYSCTKFYWSWLDFHLQFQYWECNEIKPKVKLKSKRVQLWYWMCVQCNLWLQDIASFCEHSSKRGHQTQKEHLDKT